ncbi:MAG: O-antigen polysaccharide polymerase Wzy family protein [Fusobacterium mortiferum]|nr:O-antigen polysaccharide polymerase Wzy family protein [Fusobacterium mortiferum]
MIILSYSEIIFIVLFFYLYYTWNLENMIIVILILLGINIYFSLKKFRKRMTYLIFLLSFFSFFLGRMVADYLEKGKVIFTFSEEISRHILLSIFLSLIFLQLGFSLCEKFNKRKISIQINYFSVRRNIIQKTSLIFFMISSCIYNLLKIEQIIFIKKYSYLELYTDFSSHLPKIIQIIGNSYIIYFYIYLATNPPILKLKRIIYLFYINTFLILLSGDRGEFFLNVLTLLIYIFRREYLTRRKIIKKKYIIIGIILLPIIISGMSYLVYLREGIDIGQKNILKQFIRFFRVTGNTVDILGYGKLFERYFDNYLYSLGEVIEYFKYNPISVYLNGYIKPQMHTKEYIETMRSYSHLISYYISPQNYLKGHGRGSSYLAEIYQDFGYIGICLGSFIYGWFLSKIYYIKNSKIISIAICFLILRVFFYIPRGPALLPILVLINLTYIFAVLFQFIVIKIFQKSK